MIFNGEKDQDRWVVEDVLRGQCGGWFLDLAATDGVLANNTLVLEREFGWTGLCIEPNPTFFTHLRQNRTCAVSPSCIDEGGGEIDFWPNGGIGGIIAEDTDNSRAVRADKLSAAQARGEFLRLKTAPLAEILHLHNAPPVIDYFSLDVEGAETRILRSFPFDRYRFMSMTIERPTPELNRRLFGAGYVFVRNLKFDSFYVHESLPDLGRIERAPFEQIAPKDW